MSHRYAPVFLASSSPRRKQLLEQIGLQPTLVPAHTDEVWPPLPPDRAAVQVARDKLVASRHAHQSRLDPHDQGLWLAADTVVVVDEEILGKPKNPADAARMLQLMAGRRHQVITGFVIVRGGREHAQAVTTQVTMRPYEQGEIDAYVACGEATDKSGAYAIQSGGTVLSERLDGSLSNVVGLPIAELVAAIRALR